MSPSTAFSAKHARFVNEYLLDGNGTQAAIRAGYGVTGARVTAHRLLTNAAISSAIAARQRADAQRLGVQRQDVLKGLLEAVNMAREQMNPAAMVAALREIGKLMGLYAPERVKVDLDARQAIELGRLEAMSDEELVGLIKYDNPAAAGILPAAGQPVRAHRPQGGLASPPFTQS